MIESELWAIVLAGGQGLRLRALTRRIHGDERPKQYATLVGSRSLLRQTLDRAAMAIREERTVVVTLESHAPYIAAEFNGAPAPRVLAQPHDRGTAAGILLPAYWIRGRDPEATVAVFPCDHFIPDERAFMGSVIDAAAWVDNHPDWIVLLGAQPSNPETEYGWIEPGEILDHLAVGALSRVRRFWEKPSAETASTLLSRGCLWNTLVFVAKASRLVDVGRDLVPALHDQLARLAPFVGTADEVRAIRQAYLLAPAANFSCAVLEACPSSLAVLRTPLAWCDWGTPERVEKSLSLAGISPPWLHAGEPSR